jgi:Flp pilus assembly protein TadG
VEFALAFPLLMFLVMGIIDFGLMFQQYEVITNAAREGARVGVLPNYGTADAEARVDAYMNASFISQGGVWTRTASTSNLPLPGGGCTSVITVNVTYPHQYLFLSGIGNYFGASFTSKMLNASSTMRLEIPAPGC